MDAHELTAKTCIPCRGGIPPLTEEKARDYAAATPAWALLEKGTRLVRRFEFRGMHFLLDPVLRQLTLRQLFSGELEEVHHLAMQLPRLGRDIASAEQRDAGRPDVGTIAVAGGQPPQVRHDL